MPLLAIGCRRHTIFGLSVCVYVYLYEVMY